MAPTAQTLPTGSIAIVTVDEPSGSALKSGDLVQIVAPATAEAILDNLSRLNPLAYALIEAGIVPMPPMTEEPCYFVRSADGNDPNLNPAATGWAVRESALVADADSTEAVSA
jgi:hypothetical protein